MTHKCGSVKKQNRPGDLQPDVFLFGPFWTASEKETVACVSWGLRSLIWVQWTPCDLDLLQWLESASLAPPELNPPMLRHSPIGFLTPLSASLSSILNHRIPICDSSHCLSRSYHVISYTNTNKEFTKSYCWTPNRLILKCYDSFFFLQCFFHIVIAHHL